MQKVRTFYIVNYMRPLLRTELKLEIIMHTTYTIKLKASIRTRHYRRTKTRATTEQNKKYTTGKRTN